MGSGVAEGRQPGTEPLLPPPLLLPWVEPPVVEAPLPPVEVASVLLFEPPVLPTEVEPDPLEPCCRPPLLPPGPPLPTKAQPPAEQTKPVQQSAS